MAKTTKSTKIPNVYSRFDDDGYGIRPVKQQKAAQPKKVTKVQKPKK